MYMYMYMSTCICVYVRRCMYNMHMYVYIYIYIMYTHLFRERVQEPTCSKAGASWPSPQSWPGAQLKGGLSDGQY